MVCVCVPNDEKRIFRPHSSLGYRTPDEFAEILKSSVMSG